MQSVVSVESFSCLMIILSSFFIRFSLMKDLSSEQVVFVRLKSNHNIASVAGKVK
jgi:hypothetical protein